MIGGQNHSPCRRGARGLKVRVNMPPDISAEMEAEAQRLERSMSWVMRLAWNMARAEVLMALPRDRKREAYARLRGSPARWERCKAWHRDYSRRKRSLGGTRGTEERQ